MKKNAFIFKHKKKLFVGVSLIIASASAYAWCTDHTSCFGPGRCVTVTVCGDDPKEPVISK